MLQKFTGKPVRAFIVWEPVLPTDWVAPSTAALRRIPDGRAAQFWDQQRLISHQLGEHDRRSIVWDHIAVYPPGAAWRDKPPQPLFSDGPVVRVIDPATEAIHQALAATSL